MNAVITLGIDMSSQPKGIAACALTWEADRAVAATPCLGCDDGMLSEMIAKSHAVGIDAPFGWPAEFAVAVGAWRGAWVCRCTSVPRIPTRYPTVQQHLGHKAHQIVS